jgi:hypothetical protein
MIIQRDRYLKKADRKKREWTRKGHYWHTPLWKSVLLNTIYHDYLLDFRGKRVPNDNAGFGSGINAKYRNPLILGEYIRKMASQSMKCIMFF